ncbi:MAG TPA: hypothetical protein VEI97_09495 [bacterium]|nr:hypothetical protein [bacterium]
MTPHEELLLVGRLREGLFSLVGIAGTMGAGLLNSSYALSNETRLHLLELLENAEGTLSGIAEDMRYLLGESQDAEDLPDEDQAG